FLSRALLLDRVLSFPTRRSSDLSIVAGSCSYSYGEGIGFQEGQYPRHLDARTVFCNGSRSASWLPTRSGADIANGNNQRQRGSGDRKSTRLNSSHQIISYAVFCL